MAGPEVEIILHDTASNKTRHLYGHLISTLPINVSLSEVKVSVPYDSQGAMTYTFAVLLVYSISIFLLIATLSRRKTSSMKVETEVNTYMKGLEYVNKQCKMDQVLYARFRIPGNFVGMRSDTRRARYMNKTAGIQSSLQDNRNTSSSCRCGLSSFSIPPESTEQLDYFDAYRGRVRRQALLSVDISEDSDDDIQVLPAITNHQQQSEKVHVPEVMTPVHFKTCCSGEFSVNGVINDGEYNAEINNYKTISLQSSADSISGYDKVKTRINTLFENLDNERNSNISYV